MAKVQYGPTLSSVSGSIGGTVFSKWKGRAYVRTRVTPSNPKTVLQKAQRLAMAQCTYTWHLLNAPLQGAWKAAAAAASISTFNAFSKANASRFRALTFPFLTPSTSLRVGMGTPTITSPSSGEVVVTFVAGSAVTSDMVRVAYYQPGAKDATVYAVDDGVLVSTGSVTLTGLTPGAAVYVGLANCDAATKLLFAPTVGCTITVHA